MNEHTHRNTAQWMKPDETTNERASFGLTLDRTSIPRHELTDAVKIIASYN